MGNQECRLGEFTGPTRPRREESQEMNGVPKLTRIKPNTTKKKPKKVHGETSGENLIPIKSSCNYLFFL